MKAYKDKSGRVRLFRPDQNMNRLDSSMKRLGMPSIADSKVQLIELLKQLLLIDQDWVPDRDGYRFHFHIYPSNVISLSMYIRPTAIGTSPFLGVQAADHIKLYVIMSPVGPYYK